MPPLNLGTGRLQYGFTSKMAGRTQERSFGYGRTKPETVPPDLSIVDGYVW